MGICQATTMLPKNLTDSELNRSLEILGFGSAPKILDNPYPLGGYPGIEMGLSTEFIPLQDLAVLGSTSTDKGEFNYYVLSFAKGLYYNVDIHVHFTPFIQGEDVQTYGGQLRWGFYEAKFFPLSLSTVVHVGGANFGNLINISTLGADIVGTVNFDNLAIFFGVGQMRASGKFIGGANGVTANQLTSSKDVMESHTVFGLNVDFYKMFVAFEVDRYVDSVYSGKVGMRF